MSYSRLNIPDMTATKRIFLALALAALLATLPVASSQAITGKCAIGQVASTDGVQYQCVAKKWQVAKLRGTLVLLAASSLTDVAPKLEKVFKKIYPQSDLIFSFGGSSTLAQQAINGVPADLFLSAGPAPMKLAGDKNALAGAGQDFASNSLVIAVLKENPAQISAITDLARAKIAVCAIEVPCGALAQSVAKAAKITLKPVTYELNVKSVQTKIVLGEVDAGLIYRTDVLSNPKLMAIEIPENASSKTIYSIAPLPSSKVNVSTRDAFISFLLSTKGQLILAQSGFAKP
jgi:molybdate transport system substrate-binding protein